jgi:hypothetical protein
MLYDRHTEAVVPGRAGAPRCLTGITTSCGLPIREANVGLGYPRYRDGHTGPPKSIAGRRTIPLSLAIAQALWEARKAAPDATDEGLVFTGKDCGHLDATSVARWFRAAAEKAGVPWATPHCRRHTCASWLLQRGFSIKQVQVWLGHANAAITLGVYAHLIPEDLPASPFGDDLGTMTTETGRNAGTRTPHETADLRVVSS